jgi:hypothetical protein
MGNSRGLHRLLSRLSVVLGLAVLGCRATAAPTATPEVLADCFWSAQAFAWVDTDGNGTPDAGEPPLAGVAVTFSLTFLGGATTDADGLAQLSGMHPGECLTSIEQNVVAVAPEGYVPTTALVLAYAADQARYEFGFQPAP